MRLQRATRAPRNWFTDVDLSKSTFSLWNCERHEIYDSCITKIRENICVQELFYSENDVVIYLDD